MCRSLTTMYHYSFPDLDQEERDLEHARQLEHARNLERQAREEREVPRSMEPISRRHAIRSSNSVFGRVQCFNLERICCALKFTWNDP